MVNTPIPLSSLHGAEVDQKIRNDLESGGIPRLSLSNGRLAVVIDGADLVAVSKAFRNERFLASLEQSLKEWNEQKFE